jgi:hypothetical protein
MTTGYENVAFGTHAGQTVTTARQSSFFGAYSGFNATGERNTFLGAYAGNDAGAGTSNVGIGYRAGAGASGTGLGNGNVAIGQFAMEIPGAVGGCIAIGGWAGRYADNNRQVFIDTNDRTNIAGARDSGLIYGKGEATPATQVLHFNASTRLGRAGNLVADLPTAAVGFRGFRSHVIDSSVAYATGNLGVTVVGGGNKTVPVVCVTDDGSVYRWAIG